MCHTFTLHLLSWRRAGINLLARWLGYEMEDKAAWFDSQQEQRTKHFSETSRPDLGPTQLPTQWVLMYLALKIKWLVCESDYLVLKSRTSGAAALFTHTPYNVHVKNFAFTFIYTFMEAYLNYSSVCCLFYLFVVYLTTFPNVHIF